MRCLAAPGHLSNDSHANLHILRFKSSLHSLTVGVSNVANSRGRADEETRRRAGQSVVNIVVEAWNPAAHYQLYVLALTHETA